MLNIRQFREEVIKVALETLDLYSLAAEELVLGTQLVESRLTYLRQRDNGPALGVGQMEPATHNDIWDNFLKYKPELAQKIKILCHLTIPESLIGNLWYSTAMTRVHYYRVPTKLPAAGDLEGQAKYWKLHYNTPLGAGTVQKYMDVWHKYMEV